MKTNKSFTKRLKRTKSGKLLARNSGQSHFNAKERRAAKYAKKRNTEFHMSNKLRSRYLVNL
ncbi:MAG: 50S ribosomal protein L35 [Parcubacteria group bacterium]